MLDWIDDNVGIADININTYESRQALDTDLVLDVRYYFKQIHPNKIKGTMPKDSLINIADLIRDKVQKGWKIILHCQSGIDRAPFTAVVYLVRRYDMDVSEAYDIVMEKRSQTKYHPEWETWLREHLHTTWAEIHDSPV